MLLGSAIVAMLVVVMTIALGVFRLPFDSVAGIVAGVTGNPAILGFANSDRTDRSSLYRLRHDFPSMTVLKKCSFSWSGCGGTEQCMLR